MMPCMTIRRGMFGAVPIRKYVSQTLTFSQLPGCEGLFLVETAWTHNWTRCLLFTLRTYSIEKREVR